MPLFGKSHHEGSRRIGRDLDVEDIVLIRISENRPFIGRY
jgi:hypothetical protein